MTPTVQAVDWLAIGPVLVMTAALLAVLLVQAVAPRAGRLLDVLGLAGIAGAGAFMVALVGGPVRQTFCATAGLCSYEVSRITIGLQAAVLLAAVVCVFVALGDLDPRQRVEHHALLLSAVIGALVLAGARDLLTILIGLEVASLPVVGLVALRRDRVTSEAAVKLLLVSVVSFGLSLLGTALLYTATGSVHLAGLSGSPGLGSSAGLLGAAFLVGGIGYKVAALPFALWTPDVYAGSPLPVVVFLTTVSKAAGLAALAAIVVLGMPALTNGWLTVVVAVTMTVGNLVALTQQEAVRLIAWSTIAHGGWLLLPLTVSGAGPQLIGAATTYLLAYVAATLVVLTVVILLARHHEAGARHLLSDYAGLVRTEPVAGVLLLLGLLSLAGLPPGVAGLIAKIAALGPVVGQGVWWLAAVAAVNIAIGLVYYARWAKAVIAAPTPATPTWRVTFPEGAGLSFAAAALVAFSVLPGLMV